jgi:hypothetical protein
MPTFTGYMRGLFQSERVNMLRMSETNAGDHQAIQHMLTDAGVDWKGFSARIAQDTDALLGGQDAFLLLDGSAFAKKGEVSAGVARQWNGRLGKVDNCQVGVFATLCRGDMASLVDARLYLPKAWSEDPVRCRKAAIPEDERVYRSKSQLALEMVVSARQRGLRSRLGDGRRWRWQGTCVSADARSLERALHGRCPLRPDDLPTRPRSQGAELLWTRQTLGSAPSPRSPPCGSISGRPRNRLGRGAR